MNAELLRAIVSNKYLDDQIALSPVQALVFGKAASTLIPGAKSICIVLFKGLFLIERELNIIRGIF